MHVWRGLVGRSDPASLLLPGFGRITLATWASKPASLTTRASSSGSSAADPRTMAHLPGTFTETSETSSTDSRARLTAAPQLFSHIIPCTSRRTVVTPTALFLTGRCLGPISSGLAEKPASVTAATRAASVTPGAQRTCASRVSNLTLASMTPGTAARARCTAAPHESAQFIPSTSRTVNRAAARSRDRTRRCRQTSAAIEAAASAALASRRRGESIGPRRGSV
mmetsp:Transcript_8896/g.22619  ORF Transcript_8896/g.22619 Transcript_8896/m.22619 type:complete len:224 (-) Transcript_8896:46-717(-)